MKRMVVAGAVAVALLTGCAGASGRSEVAVDLPLPVEEAGGGDGAAGDGAAGGGIAASCAAVVKFKGEVYDGYNVKRAPKAGEKLGQGVFPPCNDTGGSAEKATKAPVRAIKGVDPARAIFVESNANFIWVKSGTKLPKSLRDLVQ